MTIRTSVSNAGQPLLVRITISPYQVLGELGLYLQLAARPRVVFEKLIIIHLVTSLNFRLVSILRTCPSTLLKQIHVWVKQMVSCRTLICVYHVAGLDNYVKHRKSVCATSNSTSRPQNAPVKVDVESVPKDCTTTPEHIDNNPNLKADDFFSSLELQSSAKKTTVNSSGNSVKIACGVVTRSRASAAILANTSSRDAQFTSQQKSDSELLGNMATELFSAPTDLDTAASTCLMKTESRDNIMQSAVDRSYLEDSACEEESNEEYEDEDEDEEDDGCPPRSHTGGKWKPGDLTRGSPPSWTRTSSSSTHAEEYRGSSSTGGWSLLLEECAGSSAVAADPPPHFTGGKWKPTLPNQAVIRTQQVSHLRLQVLTAATVFWILHPAIWQFFFFPFQSHKEIYYTELFAGLPWTKFRRRR